MRKEYDFSKGERGKFHRPNARIRLPIYLNAKNLVFLEKIAKEKRSDVSTIVNAIIESDIALAKVLR